MIARIPVSPEFLSSGRTRRSAAKPLCSGTGDAHELFPLVVYTDDELLARGGPGELTNPQQLQKQVKRMLADAKARCMSAEFFGQWLGFYRFDQFKGVDTGRFPEFTDDVRSAMYDEAVSFFEYIVRNDRPTREILSADYTFMNKTLAEYYGVKKEIKSTEAAERSTVRARSSAVGVAAGRGATTTSAPLRTSPVKRRLDSAPHEYAHSSAARRRRFIPADDKLPAVSRCTKLEAHKRNATCANCHARIDPLGFRWNTSIPQAAGA